MGISLRARHQLVIAAQRRIAVGAEVDLFARDLDEPGFAGGAEVPDLPAPLPGEVTQVGRCCLKPFADRLKQADAVIAFSLKLDETEVDAEERGIPGWLLPAQRYMSFVVCAARLHGWIPRSGEVRQGHYVAPNADATASVAERWMRNAAADTRELDGGPAVEDLDPSHAHRGERSDDVIEPAVEHA